MPATNNAAVDATVAFWRARGLARDGAGESQLRDAERRLGARLPATYRSLLSASDGMVEGAADGSLFRFWSLSELEFASEEVGPNEAANYRGLIVFADYSLHAHSYGLYPEDGFRDAGVFLVGGPFPRSVARSFSEFLDLYLRQSPRLF